MLSCVAGRIQCFARNQSAGSIDTFGVISANRGSRIYGINQLSVMVKMTKMPVSR